MVALKKWFSGNEAQQNRIDSFAEDLRNLKLDECAIAREHVNKCVRLIESLKTLKEEVPHKLPAACPLTSQWIQTMKTLELCSRVLKETYHCLSVSRTSGNGKMILNHILAKQEYLRRLDGHAITKIPQKKKRKNHHPREIGTVNDWCYLEIWQ